MNTSQIGLALVKGFEGFRSAAYDDSAGLPTIGYGHLIKKGENYTEISEAEAETILAGDLFDAEEAVNELVKVWLTQNQFDALVSFVFNEGKGKFASSTLLKLLNAGNYTAAAQQFSRWVYVGKQVSLGLTRRREAEANLFRGK